MNNLIDSIEHTAEEIKRDPDAVDHRALIAFGVLGNVCVCYTFYRVVRGIAKALT